MAIISSAGCAYTFVYSSALRTWVVELHYRFLSPNWALRLTASGGQCIYRQVRVAGTSIEPPESSAARSPQILTLAPPKQPRSFPSWQERRWSKGEHSHNLHFQSLRTGRRLTIQPPLLQNISPAPYLSTIVKMPTPLFLFPRLRKMPLRHMGAGFTTPMILLMFPAVLNPLVESIFFTMEYFVAASEIVTC